MRTIALSVSLLVFATIGVGVGIAQQKDAVADAPRTAAPIVGGTATLSPENTRIQFVGTHVGPGKKPDPRTGVFTKFAGKAEVDAQKKALKSISFDIQTGSLETPISKLTNHLRSPDFFDARQYPTAKFESTSVSPGDGAGKYVVTGKLNLLKATKELQIPVVVNLNDKGLHLFSEFKIDRTEFGMTGLTEGVHKEVAMTVTIGPTSPGSK